MIFLLHDSFLVAEIDLIVNKHFHVAVTCIWSSICIRVFYSDIVFNYI